jgi:hypothetical protein
MKNLEIVRNNKYTPALVDVAHVKGQLIEIRLGKEPNSRLIAKGTLELLKESGWFATGYGYW